MVGMGLSRSAIQLDGFVKYNTGRAVLVEEETAGEVWIPHKVIEDWCFKDSSDKRELGIEDLHEGDYVALFVKKWFVDKERLF